MYRWADMNRLERTFHAQQRVLCWGVAVVVAALFSWWVFSAPAWGEESSACQQYDCGESTSLTPAPEQASPADGIGTGSLETTSGPSTEDGIQDGIQDGASVPEESIPSESTTSQDSTSPEANTIPESTGALEGITSPEETTTVDKAEVTKETTSTEETTSSPEDSSSRPIPYYPYDGEPCQKKDCGLGFAEPSLVCAYYETASGKQVVGCSETRPQKQNGCYEMTFWTSDGRLYSDLDTCSSEKVYAPPEPPDGKFRYWDPKSEEDFGFSFAPQMHTCYRGAPDCGLSDKVPDGWGCYAFFGTIHGTVRGCIDEDKLRTFPQSACVNVRLFDEASRPIGTMRRCPEVAATKPCGANKCGEASEVPKDWKCARIRYTFGDLYGSYSRVETRCEDPIYRTSAAKKVPDKNCVLLFDDTGRQVGGYSCDGTSPGSRDLGRSATKDAFAADDTLDPKPQKHEKEPEGSTPPEDSGGSGGSGGGTVQNVQNGGVAVEPQKTSEDPAESSGGGRESDGGAANGSEGAGVESRSSSSDAPPVRDGHTAGTPSFVEAAFKSVDVNSGGVIERLRVLGHKSEGAIQAVVGEAIGGQPSSDGDADKTNQKNAEARILRDDHVKSEDRPYALASSESGTVSEALGMAPPAALARSVLGSFEGRARGAALPLGGGLLVAARLIVRRRLMG